MKRNLIKGLKGASKGVQTAVGVGTVGTAVVVGTIYQTLAGTPETEPKKDDIVSNETIEDTIKDDVKDTKTEDTKPDDLSNVVYENDAMKQAKEQLKNQTKKPDENNTEDKDDGDDEKVEEPDLSLVNAKKEAASIIAEFLNSSKNDFTENSYDSMSAIVVEVTKMLEKEDVTLDELLEYIEKMKETKTELVETKELKTELVFAQTEIAKAYTEESKQKLLKVMEEASAIVTKKDATKEDVAKSLKMIRSVMMEMEADKTELSQVLEKAKKVIKDDWSLDSFSEFNVALEKATEVMSKKTASVEEVKSASNSLTLGIENLKVDTASLEKTLATAKGLNTDDYEDSILLDIENKITEVETFLKGTHKQSAINEMEKELISFIDNKLAGSLFDKTELEEALEKVQTLKEDVYTPNSWTIFTSKKADVINKAIDVIGRKKSTFAEIENSKKELTDLQGMLVERANKTALKNMIDTVSSLDETKFTPNSWKQLIDNKTIAKNVLKDLNATQEVVDNTTKELLDSKNTLQTRADVSSLKEMINDLNTLSEKDYTLVSWANLMKQKENSTKVVEDLNATQSEVNNSLNDLAKAITNLCADTTDLQTVVTKAKEETTKEYTQESIAVLNQAITNAETIIAKDKATLVEVSMANDEIVKALSLLEVDTTELETLLVELKGYDLKDYTDESFEVLIASIKKAETVLNEPTLEKVADIVAELKESKKQLQAFVPADLTTIQETITKAKRIMSGDFSSESFANLQTALSKAETVVANTRVKQELVDVTNEELNQALANLTVDVTKLETLIKETKDLNPTDYKSGYTEFKSEWDKASALLLDTNVKQSVIDEQTVSLQEKIDALVVIGEADKEELKTLLAEIETLKEVDYTPNSWNSMKTVQTKAIDIVNNIKVPQTQVDNVKAELETAKTNLVTRANKTVLLEELKIIDALEETKFTPNSWTTMISEKEKVQLIVDDLNATQQDVDNAYTKLNESRNNLIVRANTQNLENLLVIATNNLKDNYSQITKDNVQLVINKVNSIKDNANISQKEIDDVVIELNDALLGLSADTTELQELVTIAEKELTKAWSVETKASLTNAINGAKTIIAKNKISLEEVQNAKVSINTNISNLIADTSNLQDSIDVAKKLKLENYTDESFAQLQEVIAKVEIVVQTPTLETVETATQELADAIGKLQAFIPANMEVLGQTIVKAENIIETDYSFASYNNLKGVLTRAKETVLKDRVSQKEIDSINTELQTAINNLTVDKTELETLVNSSASYQKDDYKSGFEEFKAVWNTSSVLLENSNAKQSEINNAISSLSSKIDALVLYNNANKTELTTIMNVVTTLVESDYTPTTWGTLSIAKTKAQSVLDNKDATQAEVSNAVLELTTAKNNLIQRADLTTIKEVLAIAESKLSGNYTTETLNVLNQKITNAKTVINNVDATQNEVDSATQELNNAISGLKISVDKTGLETKLEQAKALNSKDYTVETFAKLQTAITNAESILSNENATQQDVDNATNSLTTAMNGLEFVPTVANKRKECEQVIAQGYALLNDTSLQLPSEYRTALKNKVDDADGVLAYYSDDELSVQEIQTYIDAIKTAMKNFNDNLYDVQGFVLQCQAKIAEARAMDTTGYSENSITAMLHYANHLEESITKGQSYVYLESAYGWLMDAINNLAPADQTVYVNEQAPAEILALLNAERKQLGLTELVMDTKLCEATTIRATEAKDQTGLFVDWAHKRPDGRKWSTVLDEIGYHQSFAGENAASGYASGASLYNGWLNSQGHKDNMLTPSFTKVGISMIKVGEGQWISYMILAR